MKVDTAIITINAKATLQILLTPETKEEYDFMVRAQRECADIRVAFADDVAKALGWEKRDED